MINYKLESHSRNKPTSVLLPNSRDCISHTPCGMHRKRGVILVCVLHMYPIAVSKKALHDSPSASRSGLRFSFTGFSIGRAAISHSSKIQPKIRPWTAVFRRQLCISSQLQQTESKIEPTAVRAAWRMSGRTIIGFGHVTVSAGVTNSHSGLTQGKPPFSSSVNSESAL